MYDFFDISKPQLDLVSILKQLDTVLAQVALSRDQHLAFHIALQQTISKLEIEKVQG